MAAPLVFWLDEKYEREHAPDHVSRYGAGGPRAVRGVGRDVGVFCRRPLRFRKRVLPTWYGTRRPFTQAVSCARFFTTDTGNSIARMTS